MTESLPISRRSVLAAAAATAATLGMPGPAAAQAFPDKNRPIRGIAPAPVGSTVDTLARAYAQAMGEALGTTIVIENRPGAEGSIGMQAVKSSPADGHTLLFTSSSTQVVSPHLFKQMAYDPLKDFIPLGGTMKVTLLMVVGPSLASFKTMKEFVEAAKASPGKFSYASVSATTRLAGEMISKAAGIKLLNVPYKSYSDLTSDLISGRVDILVADVPSTAPLYKQGVRPFAVAGSSRLAAVPDVPTMQEQGMPGLEIVGWHAAYAPANTPATTVAALRDALRKATTSKVVKDFYSNFGTDALDLVGEDFAAFQRTEFEKWGKAVSEAGMQGTL
jgi:tripartite-type tricarboxylate transporter receptor subunit TctC